jgi:hypothetical protein
VTAEPVQGARGARSTNSDGDFFEMLGRPARQANSARLEAPRPGAGSDVARRLGRRVLEAFPDA